MTSPPISPPRYGASRTVGGIIRGRAYGNVPNHADEKYTSDETGLLPTPLGKLNLFITHMDPKTNNPYMSLKYPMGSTLEPILTKIARSYSPIRSMLFYFFSRFNHLTLLLF